MTDQIEAFVDVSFSKTNRVGFSAIHNAITANASSPVSPFLNNNVSVTVLVTPENSALSTAESENRSATLGATFELPFDWKGEADYTWSGSETYQFTEAITVDDTALAADLNAGRINPFVDQSLYPLDVRKYYVPDAATRESELHEIAFRAAGSLPQLPWGAPTLTLGLSRRISKRPEFVAERSFPLSPVSNTFTVTFANEQITDSLYAETRVPLVKEARFPLVHSLEAELAGRVEQFEVDAGTTSQTFRPNAVPPTSSYVGPTLNGGRYYATDKYDSNNYSAGLKFNPIRSIAFRVSRATAFLPPTPAQLIKNTIPNPNLITITDPKNNNLRYAVPLIIGGNPDLKPQTSESWNAGVIWQPTGLLKGLRVNLEYYRIQQFDAISTLTAQLLVTNEGTFPDRITRDAAGLITLIDNSAINLFERDTRGWDATIDYHFSTPLGSFAVNAGLSFIESLTQQLAFNGPKFEYASYANEGGVPELKGSAGVVWQRGPWTVGWNSQYVGEYNQWGIAGGPVFEQARLTNPNAVPQTTYTLPQGSKTVDAQVYHDAFVTYRLGESLRKLTDRSGASGLALKAARGVSVQFGVRNVFNTIAPLDTFQAETFYLSPYGDTRLRSYWVTVKKAF
ncbi:TonB-dependent receptor domain-containing protein [Oleiharenicola lentus]|uniref:TonB-dependent receptor domain-containing protein n=1 Tax=Oleiharenicola lentus TaxID=2508720 RepID=UPI003F672E3F